jgi:alcohol dehydrogenase (NADP+)
MIKNYQLPNGDSIPAFGLGTWKSPPGQVYEAVKTAFKLGYTHIDCAPIYKNEPEVGRGIKESLTEGIVKREEIWITSKLWNNAHESDQVIPAIKKTLTDLQLDYLDLFLIHWPIAVKPGILFPNTADDYQTLAEVPLTATWQGMEAALKQGLCKHIGVSNFSQQKINTVIEKANHKPEVNQIECHPYLQQNDLLAYCRSQDILITAYSPLGSGDVADIRYAVRPDAFKKTDEPSLLAHPLILEIAAKHSFTPAQVLIAWGINRDTVVIPKSVNPQRLADNLASADIILPQEDRSAIATLDRHYRYVDGSFWELPESPYTVANLWA